METKEQISAAFKAELQALLDKYNAELEAKDHWQGYSECGEDVRMIVDIPAIYDSKHNCMREYTEIDLGGYIWPTEKQQRHGAQGE
jgi:hypothetical protein